MSHNLEVQAKQAVEKFLIDTSKAPHRDEFVLLLVDFARTFGLECVGKLVQGEVARNVVDRTARGEA